MDYMHLGQARLKVSRPVLGTINFGELTEEPASSDCYLRRKRDMQRATVSDVANSCEQEGVAIAAA